MIQHKGHSTIVSIILTCCYHLKQKTQPNERDLSCAEPVQELEHLEDILLIIKSIYDIKKIK